METTGRVMVRLVWVVVLGVAGVLGAGCTTNAATGSYQLDLMSRSEEIAAGERAAAEALPAYGGAIEDEVVQAYVRRVGMKVAAEVEPEYVDLPWEFTALNKGGVNAFALPGGKIFITRGLLERMGSEAQLAGVLAHEVGHVTAEHHDLGMQRRWGLGIGAQVAQVVAGWSGDQRVAMASDALVSGAGLFALRYDREQEHESDELGLRYMTRAGYNPVGLVEVMAMLDELSGNAPGSWTSTHPAAGDRVEELEGMIRERYASEASSPSYVMGREAYRERVLGRLR